jgi:hypothetical protein
VGVQGAIAIRAGSEQGAGGVPADSLTLDDWDGEKSKKEDIEASEDDESLVSSGYDTVHRFRARGRLEDDARTDGQRTTRLDGLSIAPRCYMTVVVSDGDNQTKTNSGSTFGPSKQRTTWTRRLQLIRRPQRTNPFLWSLIHVPIMSQQQGDDGQQTSGDNPGNSYGYPVRSLLGRVQPAPEIPDDLFSLSGPVSRGYFLLDPVSRGLKF